jgi:hypothetical protein
MAVAAVVLTLVAPDDMLTFRAGLATDSTAEAPRRDTWACALSGSAEAEEEGDCAGVRRRTRVPDDSPVKSTLAFLEPARREPPGATLMG